MMTPTPATCHSPASSPESVIATGPGLAIVLAMLLLGAGVIAWALLRAGQYPATVGLVTALSVLTMLAMGGYVVTGAILLGTIAATGTGALAGAVSAVWRPSGGP